MKSLKLAVIGKDVSKSTSPEIHKFIAENMGNSVEYSRISLSEDEFEDKIDGILSELDGCNVTIPYKLSIIPHLKKVAGDGKVFGAVNTVTTRDMCGDNTDGLGFMAMLRTEGVDVKGKKVLLLGAGGAGRSVAKKLIDAGALVSVFDKKYENICSLFEEFGKIEKLYEVVPDDYFLIINATGVGMHKTEGVSPVGADILSRCRVAVDLIYTPIKSEFLRTAESEGKKIINGSAMLFYQAYYSECIYFGVPSDDGQAKSLFEKFKGRIK